ncbi:MAG: hypothetical protein A2Z78_00430 [Candidatus Nealsonbacteria bacterium RBG_13_36_15]|uniref:Uncharacterized protein n=1 Tax=Candidatus Nealsonbacteria bacterium RBG_13_36_15 TaxID=1801660 RepID=A0A1G2DWG8_9BACT|nr:MAG: hypothetical protein A2Z78_00430 [Candidatus Nealsonbacteria bacterium RBG_13_36_15]
MEGTTTEKTPLEKLLKRLRAYFKEERSLIIHLSSDHTPSEKKRRQGARLRRLQTELMPELFDEIRTEIKAKRS